MPLSPKDVPAKMQSILCPHNQGNIYFVCSEDTHVTNVFVSYLNHAPQFFTYNFNANGIPGQNNTKIDLALLIRIVDRDIALLFPFSTYSALEIIKPLCQFKKNRVWIFDDYKYFDNCYFWVDNLRILRSDFSFQQHFPVL